MADSFLERIFKSVFRGDSAPRPRYTQDDVDYLAKTIFGEAEVHERPGQAAVGHVILNRSRAKRKSIKDVVLEPKQFEPWGRADRRKAMESLSGVELEHYRELARNILDGRIPDPTYGATHFFNPALTDAWTRFGQTTFQTGSHPNTHVFKRNVDNLLSEGAYRKPRRKPR